MMDSNIDEDIFYSDEEFSDSDIYQASDTRESQYYSTIGKATEAIFSNRLRQNSNGAFSSEGGSQTLSNPYLNDNRSFNTIDSPITQISSGIQSLLSGDGQRFHKANKQLSYSSMAKKEPLQTQKPQNIIKINKPEAAKKPVVSPNVVNGQHVKVQETALSAGYRFKARNPEADPRYPQDQQLMVGPIPGNLEHDVIYNSLRGIFQARGPVCFMFVHKSAVKDNDSGKLVKFGYVVFAEKGVAQKVIREGTVTLGGGHKIKIRGML